VLSVDEFEFDPSETSTASEAIGRRNFPKVPFADTEFGSIIIRPQVCLL
jgi:hypothetical protein